MQTGIQEVAWFYDVRVGIKNYLNIIMGKNQGCPG
jgi:hypothetical protein